MYKKFTQQPLPRKHRYQRDMNKMVSINTMVKYQYNCNINDKSTDLLCRAILMYMYQSLVCQTAILLCTRYRTIVSTIRGRAASKLFKTAYHNFGNFRLGNIERQKFMLISFRKFPNLRHFFYEHYLYIILGIFLFRPREKRA